ncbi:hypothetical protein H1D32_11595 [Anaerobacillus sp. CMMVII]|uniref:hypothetical protein n=1 Tax=Anaerobacillus sp. CMMVII TaxID=2755588 RepID=UPI0021B75D2D|nr:hypothetical protein [Anaerobacillus sp. CMMVII]MCT8138336.1 hypothetical protein [Anaerobacillus sp. CMMVII]
MQIRFWILAFSFIALVLSSCSNLNDKEMTDNYDNVREVAWEFIKEQGWHDRVSDDWQSARVKQIVVDKSYHLFDQTYEGTEVLSVSFKEKQELVASFPLILVDEQTNKVIGYIPGE